MVSTNKSLIFLGLFLCSLVISSCKLNGKQNINSSDEDAKDPYRTFISTDIGGTDPDDFQSMVHLLLYADVLDIEGLISSPYGPGRREHIIEVIDKYEKDYTNLVTYSDKYPTPDALRKITKQGGKGFPGYGGVTEPSPGTEWLIECARRDDDRPLYVLVWGGIEDLAQALHDAPDILPKLRVHWIGGPNKKWSPDAYQYITDNHPELWMIESNATYRGWFNGGNQSEEWSNAGFPEKQIAGKGAMGDFFMTQLGGEIKMGDTPTVSWLLKGDPTDPSKPGWGGQYVRAWDRTKYVFNKMPAETDSIEEFSILEFALPVGKNVPEGAEAKLKVENQALTGHFLDDGTLRFRFSPKTDKVYHFEVISNVSDLNGLKGAVSSYIPTADLAATPSEKYPNWWTDDPRPQYLVGRHIGAKTVSDWREEFLGDFAERINRCQTPYSPK